MHDRLHDFSTQVLLNFRTVNEGTLDRSLCDLHPDAPAASVDLLRTSGQELGLMFGPRAIRNTARMDECIIDVVGLENLIAAPRHEGTRFDLEQTERDLRPAGPSLREVLLLVGADSVVLNLDQEVGPK